jgi:trehalose PTS system EIIBC or EIIBCA component
MFIVCMAIAIVVPFLLTVLFEKKQLFAPKGEVEDAPVIQTQK